MTIVFRQAKHFTRANRLPGAIRCILIHSAECPERLSAAEDLAAWSAGSTASRASWHYAVDADSITQSVRDEDIAWHAGPANGWSIGIEHAGFARQDASGWADVYSLQMLERSAELVAGLCTKYGIPIRKLGPEDLAAGERAGLCGHVDVTMGLSGGRGHTDPGPHFPWEWYLARVRHHAGEAEPDPTTQREPPAGFAEEQLVEVVCDGETWLVSPVQFAPVSLGDAERIVAALECELPTPRLVDAIWRSADLRIDASKMVRRHDGTPATMDSPETHADQAKRLATLIGERALGKDFHLVAGAYKDVVTRAGALGLYGWHRADGTPIQPFFGGHAKSWRDYSQAVRPVRRRSTMGR